VLGLLTHTAIGLELVECLICLFVCLCSIIFSCRPNVIRIDASFFFFMCLIALFSSFGIPIGLYWISFTLCCLMQCALVCLWGLKLLSLLCCLVGHFHLITSWLLVLPGSGHPIAPIVHQSTIVMYSVHTYAQLSANNLNSAFNICD